MHTHAHEIADYFPKGMAEVETSWPNEDRMDLHITAAGQRIEGGVSISEDNVVIEMDLPRVLGFMRGALERAVRSNASKLLE